MHETREALVKFIEKLLEDRGTNPRRVSKAVGRNDAYLQQFLTRGSPKVLPEAVRQGMAALLRVGESQLRVKSEKFDGPENNHQDNSASQAHDVPMVQSRTIRTREAPSMSGESMNEAVLKDLIKRIARVEDKVFGDIQEAPGKALDPPTRRKGA